MACRMCAAVPGVGGGAGPAPRCARSDRYDGGSTLGGARGPWLEVFGRRAGRHAHASAGEEAAGSSAGQRQEPSGAVTSTTRTRAAETPLRRRSSAARGRAVLSRPGEEAERLLRRAFKA
jgi:hypothetical protein